MDAPAPFSIACSQPTATPALVASVWMLQPRRRRSSDRSPNPSLVGQPCRGPGDGGVGRAYPGGYRRRSEGSWTHQTTTALTRDLWVPPGGPRLGRNFGLRERPQTRSRPAAFRRVQAWRSLVEVRRRRIFCRVRGDQITRRGPSRGLNPRSGSGAFGDTEEPQLDDRSRADRPQVRVGRSASGLGAGGLRRRPFAGGAELPRPARAGRPPDRDPSAPGAASVAGTASEAGTPPAAGASSAPSTRASYRRKAAQKPTAMRAVETRADERGGQGRRVRARLGERDRVHQHVREQREAGAPQERPAPPAPARRSSGRAGT